MISVLCVDDDAAHLDVMKIYLEESGELTVTTATSVPAALAIIETNRFDVIVTDYQMPVMNGIEFLKRVRAKKSHLPFIIFTGKGREEILIEILSRGPDFYLWKNGDPEITFANLEETIKKAVKIGTGRMELQNSGSRYRRLFETSRDGILIFDAEYGKITDVNPPVLSLLGYSRDDILGKSIWELGIIREKVQAEQAAAGLKKGPVPPT